MRLFSLLLLHPTIFLASYAFPFFLGYFFATRHLLKTANHNHYNHYKLQTFIFSSIFALSFHAHVMVIFEILDFPFSYQIRSYLWSFALSALTLTLALFNPLLLFFYAFKRSVALTLLLYGIFAFCFINYLPSARPLPKVALAGVFISAALSGFGAVSAPYANLSVFSFKVTKEDVALLKRKLDLIEPDSPFYADLSAELALASELRAKRKRMGRVRNFLGYAFSAYCVYKVAMSIINVAFSRDPKRDPVTLALTIALAVFSSGSIDAAFWAQAISFCLVGVLVFNSVRGFFGTVLKVLRKVKEVDRGTLILTIAQVMGMHFCASLLLMRMSVPEQYRDKLTEALGDIAFNSYHRWFDRIFLVSSAFSGGMLCFFHQISSMSFSGSSDSIDKVV